MTETENAAMTRGKAQFVYSRFASNGFVQNAGSLPQRACHYRIHVFSVIVIKTENINIFIPARRSILTAVVLRHLVSPSQAGMPCSSKIARNRLSGPETRTWNGTISVISNNGRSPGFTKRGPCCDKVFILR